MFYLAAAVSDFYVPWKSMVIVQYNEILFFFVDWNIIVIWIIFYLSLYCLAKRLINCIGRAQDSVSIWPFGHATYASAKDALSTKDGMDSHGFLHIIQSHGGALTLLFALEAMNDWIVFVEMNVL